MAGEGKKRIIDLTEAAETQSGDYIAIDSTGRGTRKLPAGFMATAEDLSEEQTARQTADATLDGKITSETQARIAADNEIGEQITALDEKTEADAALIQNPTKTLSGALAHFADGANMPMVACTAEIVPKQAGTGTPSPDNVRQISGWESVSVFDTGVNLFDKDVVSSGKWLSTSTGLEESTANYCVSDYIPVKANSPVYIPATQTARRWFYDSKKNPTVYIGASGSQTYNPPSDGFIRVSILINGSGAVNLDTYQIEYGSVPTSYKTFGNTTTTPLGRTVYGGTLDVVSGVLTAYPFYPSYNGETLNGRWVCDRAVYAEGTTPPTGSQVALISGTGTIYTLTPTQVNTLLGENNVWADSGDVEITYRRDISIVLENLENALSGSNSLNTMMMSAPTETTAEEPTEDEAEDDMR